jgi:hypothetical protein
MRLPLLILAASTALAQGGAAPVRTGTFAQQVRAHYGPAGGLPSEDVRCAAASAAGVFAATARGLARLEGDRWTVVHAEPATAVTADAQSVYWATAADLWTLENGRPRKAAALTGGEAATLAICGQLLLGARSGLYSLENGVLRRDDTLPPAGGIRQIACSPTGAVSAAAEGGLFERPAGGAWTRLTPRDDTRSWALSDVRGVAYDAKGRLWFASPQGAGFRDGPWRLFTGYDGLPYDNFTGLAAGPAGDVWFSTGMGAIRYDGTAWEYRQGLRWLPDDEVRAVAVDPAGTAWFATAKGAGAIRGRPTTLAGKARFFEDEITKRHRRTPYGFVDSVTLKAPGDLSQWTNHDSDNDGLWTSMYGASQCFAWAATRDPEARRRARAAFDAMLFLGTVTQGGSHPAPKGFVARTVLPASGPDPNLTYTRARDEQLRATRDRRWKIVVPRWPRSADGQWYWKTDTSSDELDGHYFFYALYYDLAADTPEEKKRVRDHVSALTGHLVDNNFRLIDHDGLPTRWAVFNPEALNHDPLWHEERGLNSLSILSYLRTASHITAERRFDEAAARLIRDHAYAMNVLISKTNAGAGSGNQSDDEMAFMNFYNLLKYEKDPGLRSAFAFAFHRRWLVEAPELNPLFNFMYAAAAAGLKFGSAWRDEDLSPTGDWLAQSADTLKRYPLDRADWALRNSHRRDIVPLPSWAEERPGRGMRRNGLVLPIDERYVDKWNHDPWRIDFSGGGLRLADGASFLLPYYMGLYYRFLAE